MGEGEDEKVTYRLGEPEKDSVKLNALQTELLYTSCHAVEYHVHETGNETHADELTKVSTIGKQFFSSLTVLLTFLLLIPSEAFFGEVNVPSRIIRDLLLRK